jgi:hypothetical protein
MRILLLQADKSVVLRNEGRVLIPAHGGSPRLTNASLQCSVVICSLINDVSGFLEDWWNH